MSTDLSQKVTEVVENLAADEQLRVLEYARSLVKRPTGSPGKMLAASAVGISRQDLDLMQQVIEEGCERIDASGW